MTAVPPSLAEIEAFAGLSRLLVGADRSLLPDQGDSAGLAATYLDWARRAGAGPLAMLTEAATASASAGEFEGRLRRLPEEAQWLGRSIALAWLLGRWFEPAALRAASDGAPPRSVVISAEAYRGSLVWPMIGATPMGVPAPEPFGWDREPLPLPPE
ncbi:MAG TPA: hypothetical protein VD846_02220 [Allosphingosinicella sp.]|nr:hypothetical protein [Allosphingosinicella sp.]